MQSELPKTRKLDSGACELLLRFLPKYLRVTTYLHTVLDGIRFLVRLAEKGKTGRSGG